MRYVGVRWRRQSVRQGEAGREVKMEDVWASEVTVVLARRGDRSRPAGLGV